MQSFYDKIFEQISPEEMKANQSSKEAIDAQIKAIDDQIEALNTKKQQLIKQKGNI